MAMEILLLPGQGNQKRVKSTKIHHPSDGPQCKSRLNSGFTPALILDNATKELLSGCPVRKTTMDLQENRERMRRGELYHAFVSDLTADRARCASACRRFNNAGDVSRRQSLELWKE